MGISNEIIVNFVLPSDCRYEDIERLAKSVLDQDRYLRREFPHALESHTLGAFRDGQVVGFLRFIIQQPGAEEGRTPIMIGDRSLQEAYVEAFGVDPVVRRQGVGTALQRAAISYAREIGCHQIRSRSPITSRENYALKLAAGYVVHPAPDNDSFYFILKL